VGALAAKEGTKMHAGYDQNATLLMQLAPLMLWQLIFLVVSFVTCLKRRVNPWPWTIGMLIPGLGLPIYAIFSLVTWYSILDRLNKIEGHAVRT
jgi:hypothetical protein